MNFDKKNNLEPFNYAVLLIFEMLFARFPEQIEIRGAEVVVGSALCANINDDIRDRMPLIFSDTMIWLKEEGFIRFTKVSQGNYSNVTLTLRALTVLGYVPVSVDEVEERSTLMEKIQDVFGEAGNAASSELAKKIVQKVFEIFFS